MLGTIPYRKRNEPIPSSADDGPPIQTRFGSRSALKGVACIEMSYRVSLFEPAMLFAVGSSLRRNFLPLLSLLQAAVSQDKGSFSTLFIKPKQSTRIIQSIKQMPYSLLNVKDMFSVKAQLCPLLKSSTGIIGADFGGAMPHVTMPPTCEGRPEVIWQVRYKPSQHHESLPYRSCLYQSTTCITSVANDCIVCGVGKSMGPWFPLQNSTIASLSRLSEQLKSRFPWQGRRGGRGISLGIRFIYSI